jgi:hypothetical protein
VYYNEGCADVNGCDVSAEGLDMLALVALLLVGDDLSLSLVGRMCLGVEPSIGFALAEGLCDT